MIKINKKYTEKGLIDFLVELSKELGKTPSIKNLMKSKGFPSYVVYYNRFGSWNNALKKAGLIINSEHKDYSDEELLEFMLQFYKKNGRSPKSDDFILNKEGFPSPKPYYKRFGSWNNALKKAGLDINIRKDYTNEELLDMLRKKAKELGRSPSGDEVNDDVNMPNRSTYDKHFGSMNNALKLVGLEVRYQFRSWTKGELLQKLREKFNEDGVCPTQRDIDKDSSMPAKGNYRKYFGTFNNAVREAGLFPNYNLSKDELIKMLKTLSFKLRRTPTRIDVNGADGMPSYTPFVEKFGSYTAACLRAGLIPNDGRNNKIWQGWQKHCEDMARAIYKNIEIQKEDLVDGIPDIYIPGQKLFIDAKTCGYKDFKEQIKKYCKSHHHLEFWLIFKGLETKRKRVKYIYAEDLAKKMEILGRDDLAAKCYQFVRNVFDDEQKGLNSFAKNI